MTAKKRRRRRKNNPDLNELMLQLRETGLFKEGRVDFPSSEDAKISATLLEFIAPFRKSAPTDEAYRRLIALAIIAWNAAILPEIGRKELIDTTVNSIVTSAGEEWREEAENSLKMLIKHKERYFADDKRFILDYRLTDTGNEYRLSVASVAVSEDE
ncbi:MAG TPA: hypothetical protein VIK64_18445 [Anaerolineales bacterium]